MGWHSLHGAHHTTNPTPIYAGTGHIDLLLAKVTNRSSFYSLRACRPTDCNTANGSFIPYSYRRDGCLGILKRQLILVGIDALRLCAKRCLLEVRDPLLQPFDTVFLAVGDGVAISNACVRGTQKRLQRRNIGGKIGR